MNITEFVIKDFKKFCKNEFPDKKISANHFYLLKLFKNKNIFEKKYFLYDLNIQINNNN